MPYKEIKDAEFAQKPSEGEVRDYGGNGGKDIITNVRTVERTDVSTDKTYTVYLGDIKRFEDGRSYQDWITSQRIDAMSMLL